ncbi:MAG: hypothetical protein WCK02_07430 [Bacteroidota bacterium]
MKYFVLFVILFLTSESNCIAQKFESKFSKCIINKDTFNIVPFRVDSNRYYDIYENEELKNLPNGKWCVLYKQDSLKVNVLFDLENGLIDGIYYRFYFNGIISKYRLYSNGDPILGISYNKKSSEIEAISSSCKKYDKEMLFNKKGKLYEINMTFQGIPVYKKHPIFKLKSNRIKFIISPLKEEIELYMFVHKFLP